MQLASKVTTWARSPSSPSPTRSTSSCPATSTSTRSAESSPRPGSRRHSARVQHDGRGRRHRHGSHRHALLPALPRHHRRHRRIPVQRALRRRTDLHPELRQGRPRHAHGRAAPQHPHCVRLRRPDGGRYHNPRRRHRQEHRPHRRDVRHRRRFRLRRGAAQLREDRLPDLRLLRRHVHRQLDELPDRGHRLGTARQRHDPRLPLLPQGPVQARRAAGRQDRPPVL